MSSDQGDVAPLGMRVVLWDILLDSQSQLVFVAGLNDVWSFPDVLASDRMRGDPEVRHTAAGQRLNAIKMRMV